MSVYTINGIDELVKSNHNLIKFFYIQFFRKYHQKNIIFVIDMQSIARFIPEYCNSFSRLQCGALPA